MYVGAHSNVSYSTKNWLVFAKFNIEHVVIHKIISQNEYKFNILESFYIRALLVFTAGQRWHGETFDYTVQSTGFGSKLSKILFKCL